MSDIHIGVDVGLSKDKGTTIAIWRIGDRLDFRQIDHPDGHILHRLRAFRNDINPIIEEATGPESKHWLEAHICIEKPLYRLKGKSLNLIPLYMFLLDGITAHNINARNVYEVEPAQLKKFVANHGQADKIKMVQCVQRHWGELLNIQGRDLTDDEADAIGLMMMAACLDDNFCGGGSANIEWTQYQLDVVEGITAYGG